MHLPSKALRPFAFLTMLSIGFALLSTVLSVSAHAQTLTTLHDFPVYGTDPEQPYASLVQGSDGAFYGTAPYGGANGSGAIFRIDADGQMNILYSFSALASNETNGDGANPYGALVQGTDGNFYGTTINGGLYGSGTVFKLTPSGTLLTLHSFSGYPTDGDSPYAALVQGTDGNFYGTTYYGGANGNGTVFKISSDGTSFTTLVSFNNSNGACPYAPLIQASDGAFYGTTAYGGANGVGTIFKITSGGSLTSLYPFTYATIQNGYAPFAPLVQAANGSFYGTTTSGGRNGNGTVFAMTPAGRVSTLYQFQSTDGMSPYAGLLAGSDGYLYGAAPFGGANGSGCVFQLSTNGTLHQIYAFSTLNSVGLNPDGAYPYAGLIQGNDGNFYGTAAYGGQGSDGTVYQLAPSGNFATLYAFGGDGSHPRRTALIEDSQHPGTLYGTSYHGGADDLGTAFTLSANGELATIYAFTGLDGANPYAPLFQANDHNLYGTTYTQGAYGSGSVFKLAWDTAKSTWKLTTLHSFTALSGGPYSTNTDGAAPSAPVIQASDGNFYGVAHSGGPNTAIYENGSGTIFQITPLGGFNVLYTFSAPTGSYPTWTNVDGTNPDVRLTEDKNHPLTFYATTPYGGTGGTGVVYKFQMTSSKSGQLTVLHYFSACNSSGYNTDGAYPDGLIQASDGFLYGTTYWGGANGMGVVFKLGTDGSQFSVLHTFPALNASSINNDGANPGVAITEDKMHPGMFYGTADNGGAGGTGTIYRLAPDGSGFSVLYAFSVLNSAGINSDGATPEALLSQASDGSFYGTTINGGEKGGGTIFRFQAQTSGLVPGISSLDPGFAQVGDPGFTLTVNGSNFVSGATVNWNGTPLTTTFVSATQLTAQVPDSDLTTAGTVKVTVTDPDGNTSSPAAFTINSASPDIYLLDPDSIQAGSPGFTLTVDGDNFQSGAIVYWNFQPVTTTFVSATQLTAAIPAADLATAGDMPVIVVNPDGGVSDAADFIVTGKPPAISSLSPNAAAAGSVDLTLTVNGSNFVAASNTSPGSVVYWNGTPLVVTAYASSQLQATVPAVDMQSPGTASITVGNPDGTSSNTATFTVTLTPSITKLSPTSALAGGPGFTLIVTGSNFEGSSTVDWNGTPLATSYVSATQLQATVTSAQLSTPGTVAVTVVNPGSGGGTSNSAKFTVLETALTIGGVSLSRDSTTNVITAQVSLHNTGYLTASGVKVTSSVLGAAKATNLPVSVGSIAPGGTATATLTYPGSAGGSGTVVTLKVSGTFTGGSFSNLSYKVTLP